MSTEIGYGKYRLSLVANPNPAYQNIGVEASGDTVAGRPYAVVPRADFLAAVETECGVRCVPADSIVIERAELPEVEPLSDGSVRIRDLTFRPDDWAAVAARSQAQRLLALAEYLDAHPPVPPVSDEDVETLAGLMWEYAQNPSGPGDTFAETNEGERNRFRNRARRLLATGRVSVTHE